MAFFTLPALPFAYDALVGKGISKEQVTFHYDKHHTGYVTKLNAAAASNAELQKKSIEEIMATEKGPLFNLAAQIWNHTFYWNGLSPNGGGAPKGKLLDEINASFGSADKFKEEFTAASIGHFGSGWAWLAKDTASGKLVVVQTHDAANPLADGLKPLLTCDVWEHAYYIDYRNDRAAYVRAFWEAVNWDFVEGNL
jgi:Fe-Mn family superoxide dismutase